MRKISAVIITKNEERNIERCLRALDWVDEIIIVDSGSTDRTLEICQRYDCKIFRTEWLGFGKTKKLSVDSASNDWVLSIDADEEVTPELSAEIREVLSQDECKAGYRIKWQSYYVNKWIRHSGWDKVFKLKLFDRTKGNFNEDLIHEKVILKGEIGRLKNILKHYTYPDISSFIRKSNSYTDSGAQMLQEKGEKPGILKAYLHSFAIFLKMYILKAGFLDGKTGLILATNYAFTVYLKYIKFWELNERRKGNAN